MLHSSNSTNVSTTSVTNTLPTTVASSNNPPIMTHVPTTDNTIIWPAQHQLPPPPMVQQPHGIKFDK